MSLRKKRKPLSPEEAREYITKTIQKAFAKGKHLGEGNLEVMKSAMSERLDSMEAEGVLGYIETEDGHVFSRQADGTWPISIEGNRIVLRSHLQLKPYLICDYILTEDD